MNRVLTGVVVRTAHPRPPHLPVKKPKRRNTPRRCACGKRFQPRTWNQMWCSQKTCPAHPRREIERRRHTECVCKECGAKYTTHHHVASKELCRDCMKRLRHQGRKSSGRAPLGLGAPSVVLDPRVVSAEELVELEQYKRPLPYWRPTVRAHCALVERPCPYVSCRHHNYLDVEKRGRLRINFPDKEPWELEHSCSLDEAEAAGTLEEVAVRVNVTRERVRQIEAKGLRRLRRNAPHEYRALTKLVEAHHEIDPFNDITENTRASTG